MLIAVTRPVSPTLAECELTHLAREPIDVARATAQHAAYEQRLCELGARIVRVPAAPELPDAVFVEDTAIVLAEIAVITRPGAPRRRLETAAVATLLSAYRPLCCLTPPATLDGGDVLQVGRTLYVGRSGRTNEAGIEQLRSLVAPFDYQVVPIEFTGCLHLKSAVTRIAGELLLANPGWVSSSPFRPLQTIPVDAREPYAANALRIAGTVVYPVQFPLTRDRLVERGLDVVSLDCSELAKAEGAVTCCSLIFHDDRPEARRSGDVT
jgi:dimethylargininase